MTNTTNKRDELKTTQHEWAVAAIIMCVALSIFLSLSIAIGPFKQPVIDAFNRVSAPAQQAPSILDNHTPLIPHSSGIPSKLSSETIAAVDKFFAEPSVEGVIISGVDFHKNIFTNVFETYRDLPVDDFKTQDSYSLIGSEPAFNARVFKLMDGKLDCQTTDSMTGFKSYLSNPAVLWTCALSIPPVEYSTGNVFGGFLSVLLNDRPDNVTRQFIKDHAQLTSATIFTEAKE